MERLKYFSLAVCGALLFVTACNKDYDTGSPSATSQGPVQTSTYSKTGLRQLFAPLQPSMQSFSVPAGMNATVTGAQGTKLIFYPNSFRNAAGQIVSSGTVQISLLEATKPGSMIAARAATIVSGGGLLQSGGQVYVSATMGGQELQANTYGIAFAQPAYSSQPMALYYGNMNNADSVVEWRSSVSGTGTTSSGTRSDSAKGMMMWYHQFDSCTSFHWINCDYFYNKSPITGISAVTPDTSFNGRNSSVFIVFPSINSVSYMGSYAGATHTFSLNSGYEVPVGMSVHIIGISKKNGNYYYSEQLNQTISNNMSINLPLQQQPLSYIQSHLLAL
jgi:hypothetical protein